LEGKLFNLKQFLPKPGKKRGWINLGGRLLQVLFGTATTADLEGLHSTVNSLSKNQELISHSLNRQVSLFKQLDGVVRHYQETISNLTAIVKDYVIKVQEIPEHRIKTGMAGETTASKYCSQKSRIQRHAVGRRNR
jgi:hypothetical protein